MPIYEFRCPRCGTIQENLYPNTNPEPPVCPKCGVATRRKPSTFTFLGPFRWYNWGKHGDRGYT